MERGARPDPSEYLPKEYIEQHLHKFDEGAVRLMPESNFEKYGIAQRDGTSFVMAKSEIESMFEATAGDPRALEQALGLPEGFFSDQTILRIDISDPQDYGLRMPSGNEAGANDQWLPAGYLPTGVSEAVIDGGAVSSDDLLVTELDEW